MVAKGPTASECIKVVVRCRGRNHREIKNKSKVVVDVPEDDGGTQVTLNGSGDFSISGQISSARTYTVDQVYGPGSDQARFFDGVVQPLCDEFLQGFNCTIFAYGQTGAGKTFTMSGPDSLKGQAEERELPHDSGIIPRVLMKLFQHIDNKDVIMRCSFIELYNEELRDLLSFQKSTRRLKIYEQKTDGAGVIRIDGLQEYQIRSAKDGLMLLEQGIQAKRTASTKMNDMSSRSHTVFTISMMVKKDNGEFRYTKLNLVDLAGSENIGRSGSVNIHAREAGSINQSLLTLGRVINSLVDGSAYVPYRESKLTRLLQDSLGGHTKTILIANVSPSSDDLHSTQSTLEYASTAKDIKNSVQMGPLISDEVLVRELIEENYSLKLDLKATRRKDGIYMDKGNYDKLMADYTNQKSELKELRANMDAAAEKLLVQTKKTEFESQKKESYLSSLHDLESKVVQYQNQIRDQQTEHGKIIEQLESLSMKELKQLSMDQQTVLKSSRHQLNEWLLPINQTLSKLGEYKSDVTKDSLLKETSNLVDVVKSIEKNLDRLSKKQQDCIDRLPAVDKLQSLLSEVHTGVSGELAKGSALVESVAETDKKFGESIGGVFSIKDDQLASTLLLLGSDQIKKFQEDMAHRIEVLYHDIALQNTASLKQIFEGKIQKEVAKWSKQSKYSTESLQSVNESVMKQMEDLQSNGTEQLEAILSDSKKTKGDGAECLKIVGSTSDMLPRVSRSGEALAQSGLKMYNRGEQVSKELTKCQDLSKRFGKELKENVILSNKLSAEQLRVNHQVSGMLQRRKRPLGDLAVVHTEKKQKL